LRRGRVAVAAADLEATQLELVPERATAARLRRRPGLYAALGLFAVSVIILAVVRRDAARKASTERHERTADSAALLTPAVPSGVPTLPVDTAGSIADERTKAPSGCERPHCHDSALVAHPVDEHPEPFRTVHHSEMVDT